MKSALALLTVLVCSGWNALALEVYLLRHGETSWNRAKVLQGTTPYTDLTDKGVAMAEATGVGLKAAGIAFDRVYASPLRRTVHTAELVCRPFGLKAKTDARLQEIDFGDYQGIRYDAETCTDDNLRCFYEDVTRFQPRGKTAESLAQVAVRFGDFLEQELKPLDGTCERVLCVTHSVVIRAYLETVGGDRPAGLIRNCGVVVLELKDGSFRIKESGRVFYDVAAFDAMKVPRIVAHRGACDLEMAEATRAAYSNAVARVADIVKLDVQETRDGVVVMGHDETLKRNMGWDVRISQVDYAEICAKGRFRPHAGYPEETIVRLDEALEIVRPIPEIWIDFKAFSYALFERVLEQVRRAGIDESRIMVANFNPATLEYLQHYHPKVRRVAHIGFSKDKAGRLLFNGRVCNDPVAELLRLRDRLGLYGVNVPVMPKAAHRMTPEEIAALKKAGLWVSLWFVQTSEVAEEYALSPADALVTDHGTPIRKGR